MKRRLLTTTFALLAVSVGTASAAVVTVQVTNNQPMGGFTFSPPWIGFHNGTFDGFNSGAAASAGIEGVAELGDIAGISAEFGMSGVGGQVLSPADPPPFIPGESGLLTIDIGDETMNRYFSFGSMLVPSNDFFLGNDDPTAYEIFDAAGNFLGPQTIQIFAADAWDAGTEVNDVSFGAAFIVGQDAMLGTTEGGVVTPLFAVAGVDAYLASIVGQETPIGTLTDGLTPGDLLATITIVPEPASLALLSLAVIGLFARRR